MSLVAMIPPARSANSDRLFYSLAVIDKATQAIELAREAAREAAAAGELPASGLPAAHCCSGQGCTCDHVNFVASGLRKWSTPMKFLLASTLIFILPFAGLAQTARQGDEKADPTEFHSPMVLEAPFAAADPTTWNLGKGSVVTSPALGRLRRFHCDGVSLAIGDLHPREITGNQIETQMDFGVINPGHDKFVKLLFQLFNGDTKIADSAVGPFKVKEGAFVQKKATITALKQDLTTEPLTTIRITMSDWDY